MFSISIRSAFDVSGFSNRGFFSDRSLGSLSSGGAGCISVWGCSDWFVLSLNGSRLRPPVALLADCFWVTESGWNWGELPYYHVSPRLTLVFLRVFKICSGCTILFSSSSYPLLSQEQNACRMSTGIPATLCKFCKNLLINWSEMVLKMPAEYVYRASHSCS